MHLTCNAVSRSGFGCPPIKRPCLVSVDDTPGTPIPGCAKMSSTDRVTTFFAFVLMIKNGCITNMHFNGSFYLLSTNICLFK